MMRIITEEQASATYDILVRLAGASNDEMERYSFVHATTKKPPTIEYRFMGSLGYGGKFRNNGNRDCPYVDCYSEDSTPARQATIAAVNAELSALFT